MAVKTRRLTPKLKAAVETYRALQDRSKHPDGYFDEIGRWYPSDDEFQDCCGKIGSPTKKFPYSYMLHCRTAVHVAHRHGVAVADLKHQILRKHPAKREGGNTYYKAVALVDGRYLSIFDGVTEYKIGETTVDRARQKHQGGIYCYDNLDQALSADVPPSAALRSADRVVLRVRAEGSYCRYPGGKLAFSRVTPLEVVRAV
ncbi:MAG: hypothetical protein ABI670_11830 [Chloroflexota bacterium]